MRGARPQMLPRDGDPPKPAKPRPGGKPMLQLAGLRFGPLLVIERAPKPARLSLSVNAGTWWRTSCNCGREPILSSQRIKNGPAHCTCKG